MNARQKQDFCKAEDPGLSHISFTFTCGRSSSSFEEMFSMRILFSLLLLVLFYHFRVTGASRRICDCEAENLSHPGCGIIPTTSTILNGSPGSYPWMVFLYSLTVSGNSSFCGGTFISDIQVYQFMFIPLNEVFYAPRPTCDRKRRMIQTNLGQTDRHCDTLSS